MSADTLVPGVGGQHLSRYMYVTGNPVRYNDPTGHARPTEESENAGRPFSPTWFVDHYRDNEVALNEAEAWFEAHPDYDIYADPNVWAVNDGQLVPKNIQYADLLQAYILWRAIRGESELQFEQSKAQQIMWLQIAAAAGMVAPRLNLSGRPFADNGAFNRNVIEEMYRGEWVNGQWVSKDSIPGGTAGAIRYEMHHPGVDIEGKSHTDKGWQRLDQLKEILRTGQYRQQSLSDRDMAIIRALHDDLNDALHGK